MANDKKKQGKKSPPPGAKPKDSKAGAGQGSQPKRTFKDAELDVNREDPEGTVLSTNQGVPIQDNQNSLKAGDRGPSLLEDFILREKLTHFDHERIPERVVHARGSGAHGYFQVYESLRSITKAAFLQDPSIRTPVFVRFSTVAGSRGSSDLARDVRGFAVKFYTSEGNYDLVGNNMPVFFIQDAMKFPDLVHAVKPEPHHEMPQAASAHDTFWDFISLMPESAHMIMWAMSDRGIPRSFRTMEGFGVHTFRLIDEKGTSRFVKFHWKPVLGLASVVWDEAQRISGKDPDFHRRDLWEAIENGDFPEYELGLQIVEEKDEHAFDFDLLDPTKLIPEELVPVRRVGKLTLDRNPDNFFAETEQVAFHTGHVVPGIDFTNDPLLQGRLFSYTDTQLIRLGGPNFHEIPINRPIAPLHNNQRDGHMRQTINRGRVAYQPNTLGGGDPAQAPPREGGFVSHAEKMTGAKVRARGEKFFDHFSQATLFYESQTDVEKNHIVQALRFELGKVETPAIRERMVGILTRIDRTLASRVAEGLGIEVPAKPEEPINHSIPAGADPAKFQPKKPKKDVGSSPALSILSNHVAGIRTQKIAVLLADGFDEGAFDALKKALEAEGAHAKTIAPRLGTITGSAGKKIVADFSLLTTASVLFDAVLVVGGKACVEALKQESDALHFVNEAYKHCKAICGADDAVGFLLETYAGDEIEGVEDKVRAQPQSASGVVFGASKGRRLAELFVEAIGAGRHFEREEHGGVPA